MQSEGLFFVFLFSYFLHSGIKISGLLVIIRGAFFFEFFTSRQFMMCVVSRGMRRVNSNKGGKIRKSRAVVTLMERRSV
jgi:hypothetical protein